MPLFDYREVYTKMPDVYSCKVTKNEKLSGYAYAVTFDAPELAKCARAGQFIQIKCGHSRLLRRPISICMADETAITVVFEVRGDGTNWLSRRKPGDILDVLGPLGNGFSMPEGKIIAVGGGIGTAPILLTARSAKNGASAILGFRDKGKIILEDEFRKCCDTVNITTDDGSFGIHGAVTKPLEELLRNDGGGTVLACGPRPMLRAVADLCKRYSVPCQASLEERMGCGVGACLVCACKTAADGQENMSRVCKDGPVFDSEAVLW